MNKKKLIILSSIFVLLAAYTYIVEIRISKSSDIKKEAAEKIASLKQEDIKEIIVKDNESKITYTIAKDGLEWVIKETGKKAEQALVNDMISVFSSKADATIKEGENIDVYPYGIGNPKLIIDVKGGGKSELKLQMQTGDKSPIGDFTYVYVPTAKKLITVSSSQFGKFKKTHTELRDKRISDIPREQIGKISVTNKGKSYELVKEKEDVWTVSKPSKAVANQGAVGSILDKLTRLEVDKYLDSNNKKVLNSGDIKIVLTLASKDEKDKAEETFIFKKETDAKKVDSIYGNYLRANETFFVKKDLYDFLIEKDLTAVRKKDLFKFTEGTQNKILITDKKGTLELNKSGDEWMTTDKKAVSKIKISDIITEVGNIRVKQFISDNTKSFDGYGLGKNATKIAILGADKASSIELTFGKETKDGVYVRLNSENAVYLIENDLAKRINSDVATYMEEPAKADNAHDEDHEE